MIVDDHQIVREGLASLISAEDDLTVIAQAPNGKEALRKAMLYKPEIAEQWGISVKTVDTYRRRIMDKLDIDSAGKLIRKAIELEHTLH